MIFLLHVEWPEMPPYKLLLTYYMFDALCDGLEGHFLGIRHGDELHEKEVTFFIAFTNVFLNFYHVFLRFLTLFILI